MLITFWVILTSLIFLLFHSFVFAFCFFKKREEDAGQKREGT